MPERSSGSFASSAVRTDDQLRWLATRIRRKTIEALYAAGSGHAGASLSIADILAVLYFDVMRLDGPNRDRIVLSKGHAAPGLYAAMCEAGLFPEQELSTLRKIGSRLQGHPDMTRLPLLDAGTGALGQGLSIAIGYALAAKLRNVPTRAYCIVGDGELQEGQIWEAAMFAGARRLDNICCILDANRLQNETWVEMTLPLGNIADKWRSFGWQVQELDGHDMGALRDALGSVRAESGAPSFVLAHTVKGKGVSFMENDNAWHGNTIREADYRRAVEELDAVIGQFQVN